MNATREILPKRAGISETKRHGRVFHRFPLPNPKNIKFSSDRDIFYRQRIHLPKKTVGSRVIDGFTQFHFTFIHVVGD
jgi:hypothetical protein